MPKIADAGEPIAVRAEDLDDDQVGAMLAAAVAEDLDDDQVGEIVADVVAETLELCELMKQHARSMADLARVETTLAAARDRLDGPDEIDRKIAAAVIDRAREQRREIRDRLAANRSEVLNRCR